MKFKQNTKNRYFSLQAFTVSAALLATTQAAIIVEDPVDAAQVVTTHQGSDTIAIVAGTTNFEIGLFGGGLLGGDGTAEILFSDGSSNITVNSPAPGSYYYDGTQFTFGAAAGLNYVRLDLNADLVFETVLEFSTGTLATIDDDVITRYAYDDTGANLEITDAFTSVPEPSAALLLGIGALAGITLRKRVR